MALPTDWIKTRLVWSSSDSRQYEIIIYHLPVSGPSPPTNQTYAQNFADAVDQQVGAAAKAIIVSSCEYTGVVCSLHSGGEVFVAASDANNGPGQINGDHLPAQDAVVIQKGANASGRPGRGRWFIPLVPEAQTVGNQLTSGGVTAYDTFRGVLEQLIALPGGDTWGLGHYSRKNVSIIPVTFTKTVRFLKQLDRREVHPLYS